MNLQSGGGGFKYDVPFDPNQKVKCIRGHCEKRLLEEGKEYDILVVVNEGWDYHYSKDRVQPIKGVIVKPHGAVWQPPMYPYVWDADRFELVPETKP